MNMRPMQPVYRRLLYSLPLAVLATACVSSPATDGDVSSATHSAWNLQAGDVPVSGDWLSQEFVGRTVVFEDGGQAHFGIDGTSYQFRRDNYTYDWIYEIRDDGVVCKSYPGSDGDDPARCDLYVGNNSEIFVINEQGMRFLVVSIE